MYVYKRYFAPFCHFNMYYADNQIVITKKRCKKVQNIGVKVQNNPQKVQNIGAKGAKQLPYFTILGQFIIKVQNVLHSFCTK